VTTRLASSSSKACRRARRAGRGAVFGQNRRWRRSWSAILSPAPPAKHFTCADRGVAIARRRNRASYQLGSTISDTDARFGRQRDRDPASRVATSRMLRGWCGLRWLPARVAIACSARRTAPRPRVVAGRQPSKSSIASAFSLTRSQPYVVAGLATVDQHRSRSGCEAIPGMAAGRCRSSPAGSQLPDLGPFRAVVPSRQSPAGG